MTSDGTTTTVYIGNYFEWNVQTGTMTKYYYAGAERVAMRTGAGTGTAGLVWILGDHLGSTSITVDAASGAKLSERRYKPWGEVRYTEGETGTKYGFTGQRADGYINNVYWYNSRWYDAGLGRWMQPDTIVPLATQGVQAFDRYAYVNNSPVNFVDPSGHRMDSDADENGCSGARSGPVCIMDMYGYDTEAVDDSLESWVRRHPEYDPFQDPELGNGPGAAIVSAAGLRASCADGSTAACISLVAIGSIYSVGPALRPAGPVGLQPGPNYGPDGLGDPDCAGCGYLTIESYWYKSTFPTANESVVYHFNKHGSQYAGPIEYTLAAKDFYDTYKNVGSPVTLGTGEMGIKIKADGFYGIYTQNGLIVSFGPR